MYVHDLFTAPTPVLHLPLLVKLARPDGLCSFSSTFMLDWHLYVHDPNLLVICNLFDIVDLQPCIRPGLVFQLLHASSWQPLDFKASHISFPQTWPPLKIKRNVVKGIGMNQASRVTLDLA
ncbi:hypothetical protein COLO4_24499 [Corchorus olitorius]|uniref:Uncharacterized protein n=1 Tax=Corchorus olitorius TaxID=93759 RepID=A0A1R3I9K1_9ROSI|nr:hypothetical protein COLO4_24499 [Corchorus olitorius]